MEIQHRARPTWWTGRRVLVVAVVLVIAQLGFRAWAVFGGWYYFDDFALMSIVTNQHFGLSTLLTNYGGDLMPGAFAFSRLNYAVSPLGFALPAVEVLALQAIADVGAVVFLVSAFGRRAGILAPLVVFLTTSLTIPSGVWWAAAINLTPILATFLWGSWTHLNYLRTKRLRWAVGTMAITIAGLFFHQKTMLVFVIYAFVALAYFAEGSLARRARSVVLTYGRGIVAYAVVALAYLALYVTHGLNFNPVPSGHEPVSDVASKLGGAVYATGILGGPLRWSGGAGATAIARPGPLAWLAVAILVALGYEIARTRRRSKRAWILVGVFLGIDIVLVATARANVLPDLAYDPHFITELAAVSAIALGLATMPLVGAPEQVERGVPSSFLDRPARVGVAVVLVGALGTWSCATYAVHWQADHRSKQFFSHARTDLAGLAKQRGGVVPLVDQSVPEFLMWGLRYPENQTSHVLTMFAGETTYPTAVNDNLYVLADDGTVHPVAIDAARRSLPAPGKGCAYVPSHGTLTVPFDGPAIGTWWVRVAYYSAEPTPLRVTAGTRHYEVTTEAGLHSLYVEASGERYQTVELRPASSTARLCVTDAQLGRPTPWVQDAA